MIETFLSELVGPLRPRFAALRRAAVAVAKVLLGVLAIPLIPVAVVVWILCRVVYRVLATLHGLGDRTWAAASHFIDPGKEL